jgi:hypothetical protein
LEKFPIRKIEVGISKITLQIRHFLTLGAQEEQVATCPHGEKSVSRGWSEQIRQSFGVSESKRIKAPGERVPLLEKTKKKRISSRFQFETQSLNF